jgi:hypothetical protein
MVLSSMIIIWVYVSMEVYNCLILPKFQMKGYLWYPYTQARTIL